VLLRDGIRVGRPPRPDRRSFFAQRTVNVTVKKIGD
jgi:hypothetical protein